MLTDTAQPPRVNDVFSNYLFSLHDCASLNVKKTELVTRIASSESKIKLRRKHDFNVQAFLDSPGVSRRVVEYRRSQKIFIQGDPARCVMYIQKLGPVIWRRGPKVSRGFRSCGYW